MNVSFRHTRAYNFKLTDLMICLMFKSYLFKQFCIDVSINNTIFILRIDLKSHNYRKNTYVRFVKIAKMVILATLVCIAWKMITKLVKHYMTILRRSSVEMGTNNFYHFISIFHALQNVGKSILPPKMFTCRSM